MNTEINDMTLKEKSYFFQKNRDYHVDDDNFILAHIDGRSFSKMIKNRFEKPFDSDFVDMMNKTAIYLCENVQGVQLAYTQSDEISLLIKKIKPGSDIFFGGRLCKMQSIIASLATAKFNQLMFQYKLNKFDYKNILEDSDGTIYTIRDAIDFIGKQQVCQFDCKVWDVPSANEAIVWFLYRNIDCIRNSKQQTAQTYLPHKTLLNKTTDEQIQILYDEKGIEWSKFGDDVKYGRIITKEKLECTREENGKIITFKRNKWTVKNGMDLTNPCNREMLTNYCEILKV